MLSQASILEFYVATTSHEIGLFYFYMLAVICRCTLYALQQLDPLKKKKKKGGTNPRAARSLVPTRFSEKIHDPSEHNEQNTSSGSQP